MPARLRLEPAGVLTSAERTLFERFLDRTLGEPEKPFYVAETGGGVIGCGGHRVDAYGVAYLAWGMVERAHHRQGIGTALLDARLGAIDRVPHAWVVLMDTTPRSAPFDERAGFEAFRVVPDGYEPGLDTVYLRRVRV